MDKLYIKEEITDYQEEMLRHEIVIESEDDILRAIQDGHPSARVARAVLASRALKKAPEDIIRPNRILLNAGATHDVIQITHKPKTQVTTRSGEYELSIWVGRVTEQQGEDSPAEDIEMDEAEADNEPEDTGPSFVKLGDPLALGRAYQYLDRIVPGHVWNRLLTIHASRGDVHQAAEELKAKIDEMVNRIV